jgi:hypothetical protein
MASLLFHELEWYSNSNERVLAVIVRDRQDQDFSAGIFGRDRNGRFRPVHMLPFAESINYIRGTLEEKMGEWAARDDADYAQGDERGQPIDFFAPVVPPERFHQSFAAIRSGEGHSPAREIISAMMYYYEDPDGNFIEQFQTTGFDSRFWELYVFATFNELGYTFDRTHAAPDFLCQGILGEFFVEAVTVNPTVEKGINLETGPPENELERREYKAHYLPIKFGSALYSKLQKRYWDLPHISGKPIVFAVQDFHFPASMTWSEPSLSDYLYGLKFVALYNESGHLNVTSQPIREHRWGNKVIPSGFFSLPGAEHVSAVITNPQGTISKFNRIGCKAGFGSKRVRMFRFGTRYVHDENAARPAPFKVDVNDACYSETWVEGMSVFHNPAAVVPLPVEMIPGAAHHSVENGTMNSLLPMFHPYGTRTMILVVHDDNART